MVRKRRHPFGTDLAPALWILLGAYRSAKLLKKPPEETALDLSYLRKLGLTSSRLQELLAHCYVRVIQAKRGASREPEGHGARICLKVETVPLIERAVPGTAEEGPAVPCWNPPELRWCGRVILRLSPLARNMTPILAAFQDSVWARIVANPLPRYERMSRARQLIDACKRLNNRQHFLRFHAEDKGVSVRWEAVE